MCYAPLEYRHDNTRSADVPSAMRILGIEEWGFAYVPQACQAEPVRCRLHVHYHPCLDAKGGLWALRELWVLHPTPAPDSSA